MDILNFTDCLKTEGIECSMEDAAKLQRPRATLFCEGDDSNCDDSDTGCDSCDADGCYKG